jgi:ABC-2 type transport system permease protein
MSIWNAVLVITRTRFLIARNTFWRGKIGRKIALLGLGAALCVAAYGLYWLTRGIVRGITSPDFAEFLAEAARRSNGQLTGLSLDFRTYLLALPAIVLFFALVLMVLTSFTTVLSSLYLSGDIDMLLVAPVPMRAVFVVKFFGGLLTPYALLFFLLGPFLLGFGQGLGFGAAYFAVAVAVLLLLPLLPTGLGALLVMAVVRVIPARRAREIVGVIGGLVGVSWYIFSQFTRELTPRLANARLLDYLRRFDNPIAPSAWAARALVAAGEGRWIELLLYGGLFAALSVGIFILCLALAERLYYAGWSNMSTQGGRVRQRRRTKDDGRVATSNDTQSFVFRLSSFVLPRESLAVLYKDLKVFPRDLRNLQQLIFPLVLAGIWTFRLITGGSLGNGRAAPSFFNSLSALASAGISFYICLVLSGAIGGAGISREGRGFWLFKVAPISARRLLIGKLALAYLPFPIIGTLFVIFLSLLQHSAPSDFLRSLVLLLVAGLGVSSISMGLGAAFPKFNWENPRQQNSFQAGCLSPILYMAYLGVAIGVVLGVPELGRLVPDFRLVLTVGSWIFFLALTVLVVWGALAFGAARLERIEIA